MDRYSSHITEETRPKIQKSSSLDQDYKQSSRVSSRKNSEDFKFLIPNLEKTQLPIEKMRLLTQRWISRSVKRSTSTSIYFGSQTGNSQMLADELNHDLQAISHVSNVYDLQNYKDILIDDIKAKNNIILITSCFGEGEPTDNARDFFNWLMSESASSVDWKSAKFAIFGLGNQSCFPERYQLVSKNILARLIALGAKPILPMGMGDSKTLDDDFLKWKQGLFPLLGSETKSNDGTPAEPKFESKFKVEFVSHGTERPFIFENNPSEIPSITNPTILKVKKTENLCIGPNVRVCKYIEFETDLKYETGDHIGIFPQNQSNIVDELCKTLKIDPHQQFTLKSMDPKTPVPFTSTIESIVTVKQAFSQYFSLNHSPKPSFFKYLSRFTTNQSVRDYLLDLCEHDENQTKLTNEIKNNFLNVVDILDKIKIDLTFDQIAEILPKMYPRYYSISSSHNFGSNRIDNVGSNRIAVTVGSIQRALKHKVFKGLCSSYINDLKPGDLVQGFIRSSTFRLPADPKHPVLVICGGTGIAPFMGFLEERTFQLAKGVQLGPLCLLFGVRDHFSYLHKSRIEEAQKSGVITELFTVFSEESNGDEPKMFVSERINSKSPIIWNYLKNGANVYICGGVAGFGSSVYNALKSVHQTHGDGSMSSEEYISHLKAQGRCFEDLAD